MIDRDALVGASRKLEDAQRQIETERAAHDAACASMAVEQSALRVREERLRKDLDELHTAQADFECCQVRENEQINTRCRELEQQRAAHEQELERSHVASRKLASESKLLQEALRQLESDRLSLTAQSASLAESRKQLELEKTSHEKALGRLEAELNEARRQFEVERNEFEEQRNHDREQRELLHAERRELQATTEELAETRRQLDTDQRVSAEANDRLQDSLQQLEFDRAAIDEARAKSDADLKEAQRILQTGRAELEHDREQHRRQVEQLVAERTQLAVQVDTLNATRSELEAERQSVIDETVRLQVAVEQLELDRAKHEELQSRFTTEQQAAQRQLEAGRASLERDRAEYGRNFAQFEGERSELRRVQSRFDEIKQQFETDRQTLKTECQTLESDRQRLLDETSRLQEALQQFDSDRAGHEQARLELEGELEAAQQKLDAQRAQLDEQRQQLQVAVEHFQPQQKDLAEQKDKLDQDRRHLESDRQVLMDETATLQEALLQFELDREQQRIDGENLKAKQTRSAEELERARQESAAFHEASAKREADLAARQKDLQNREAVIAEQLVALEVLQKEQERAQQEGRTQLEGEKQQLRSAFESLQQERRDFLEEKMRYRPDGSTMAASASGNPASTAVMPDQPPAMEHRKPAHKRRKRRSEPDQQAPLAVPSVNVSLDEQLFRLQAERQQLQSMRTQFAEELQRMRAGRIDPASASASPHEKEPEGTQASGPKALRFLLDPGRAASRAIAEVLSEIVLLGRLSGIHIARFDGSDCRTCRLTRSKKTSPKSTADVVRTVIELHLTTDESGQNAARNSLLWEQFESSLRMIVPAGGSLAGVFSLGTAASADHKFRAIGRDVVDLATKDAAQRAGQNPVSQPGTLPVDQITQQLQKLEALLRRLSAEFNMTLELAPLVAQGSMKPARRNRGIRLFAGKRFWVGSLASASILGLAGGAYWWTSIARALGLGGQ